MKYPNKFSLCVFPRNDSIEAIADVIVMTVPECTDRQYIINEIKNKGQIQIGTFYNDIAQSKRFKIMQEATNRDLFDMIVTVKELDK